MKSMLDPNYIAGIYNYCDSRCNRCAFTNRCAVMGFMNKLNAGLMKEGMEIDYDQPVQAVTVGMHLDMNMGMMDDAIEMDITDEVSEEMQEREERIRSAASEHELTKLARRYRKKVHPLLTDTFIELVKEKAKELSGLKNIGLLSKESIRTTLGSINEHIETLMSFHFFLEVKISTAISSRYMDEELQDDDGDQKYHDGVMKVVLLSIDQLMHAWKELGEYLAESEYDGGKALAMLDQLKKMIIKEFPDAMKFKRPGFDEEERFPMLQ